MGGIVGVGIHLKSHALVTHQWIRLPVLGSSASLVTPASCVWFACHRFLRGERAIAASASCQPMCGMTMCSAETAAAGMSVAGVRGPPIIVGSTAADLTISPCVMLGNEAAWETHQTSGRAVANRDSTCRQKREEAE